MSGEMGGADSTWASIAVWDEAQFKYVEVIEHTRGEDARARYLALHWPPLILVRYVRYGQGEAIRP